MAPTRREVDAARALGEAILNLLAAHEEESAVRALKRSLIQSQQKPLMSRSDQLRDAPAVTSLLVTSKQAAVMLGVSTRTLCRMTAPKGPLQSVRFGSVVRYDVEDIVNAIASMKRATSISIKEEDSR